MAFVLRFVQTYSVGDRDAFLELERRFAEMERRRTDWPRGRRLQPYAGAEPTNTIVWEAEFPSLAEALAALDRLAADEGHEALFREQAPLMTTSRTELYEVLEL
jgi:hypothetical protein